MRICSINNQQTYFKANLPAKKTYSNMREYYKTIGDKKTAKIYNALTNKAKARLHNRNSMKAQERILDYSEEMCEEALNWKENIKFISIQTKNTFDVVKESLIGAFYGSLR